MSGCVYYFIYRETFSTAIVQQLRCGCLTYNPKNSQYRKRGRWVYLKMSIITLYRSPPPPPPSDNRVMQMVKILWYSRENTINLLFLSLMDSLNVPGHCSFQILLFSLIRLIRVIMTESGVMNDSLSPWDEQAARETRDIILNK